MVIMRLLMMKLVLAFAVVAFTMRMRRMWMRMRTIPSGDGWMYCGVCTVQEVIEDEEVAFNRTLAGGLKYFDKVKARVAAEGSVVVPGKDVRAVKQMHCNTRHTDFVGCLRGVFLRGVAVSCVAACWPCVNLSMCVDVACLLCSVLF